MAHLIVNFFSDTLGMAREMEVILPENMGAGVKTLFLLHGMSDDQSTWMRQTSIERYAAAKNLAVVMPFGGLGWYTDMHRGLDWFSFLTKELPGICRRMFPALSMRREDTFVAGLSMGGYGALKCGLRAGNLFSRVAALSGGLDAHACATELKELGTRAYWEDVFGPAEGIAGSFNDLFRAAEECALRPDIFLWCGTEDFLYQQNVRMRDHLRALGYNLAYSEGPGDHSWAHWDREIQRAIEYLVPGEGEGAWR